MKNKVGRREFLWRSGLAAAALGTVSFPGGAFARAVRGSNRWGGKSGKVIVVGGGLAGLTAAIGLRNAGYDVTVLEAQERAGGRIRTLRTPFDDGLYAEAGATRIPGNHHLTLEYCRSFDLPLVPFRPSGPSTVYYLSGRRLIGKRGQGITWPVELREDEKNLSIGGLREKYIMPVLTGDTRGFATYDWPPASLIKYDDMTWEEFLASRGASPGAIRLLTLGHSRGMVGRASALSWIRSTLNSHGRGALSQIDGGNDLLPIAMARKLGVAVRYETPALKIAATEKGVGVTFLDRGKQAELEGDYVVCAIPFSVLRDVSISFPCSEGKRKAIDTLRHTSCMKVFLQTRTRFWNEEHTDGFAQTDLPISELWNASGLQKGTKGILAAYMTGTYAEAMDGPDEELLLKEVVNQADRIYPSLRDACERGVSFSWTNDKWARGAWAYVAPGDTTMLLPHLHTPEGRVHFAGDHTSPWPGWMQGALHSGLRVAKEITGKS